MQPNGIGLVPFYRGIWEVLIHCCVKTFSNRPPPPQESNPFFLILEESCIARVHRSFHRWIIIIIIIVIYYLVKLQHLSHIASRVFVCILEGWVFLLLCSQCFISLKNYHLNVSFVKFTDLILWYMNLMNNGQIHRGNENPIQHLSWWLRKTTKNPQSGWSSPGFEPGTSRMRVSCVTTEPPRSVWIIIISFVNRHVDRGHYSRKSFMCYD